MVRSVRTLVPRSGTRAHALQGGARGAAAGSCRHTYIYASGQTRKKPGRGVPSYAHIRFRPEHIYASGRTRPARGPCRAFIHTCALQLHTYIYTSASYIHIHFRSDPENAGPVRSPGRAFMRTYTLKAGPGLRAARAAPSCIHVHFSFIHTYTLQLHTYIYTSGRTRKNAKGTYGRTCLSGAVRIQVPSMGQVNPGPPYPALVQPSPALTRTQGVAVGVWTWCTRLTRKASEMSVALRFCCGA